MKYHLFKTFSKTTETRYGFLCECAFGNWGFHAPTLDEAEAEGMKAFKRYYEVGNYGIIHKG